MLLRDHAEWRQSEESGGCSVVDGLDDVLTVATVAWRWRRELTAWRAFDLGQGFKV
jgi:hypothetical protein